jgi:hypothetical protein
MCSNSIRIDCEWEVRHSNYGVVTSFESSHGGQSGQIELKFWISRNKKVQAKPVDKFLARFILLNYKRNSYVQRYNLHQINFFHKFI